MGDGFPVLAVGDGDEVGGEAWDGSGSGLCALLVGPSSVGGSFREQQFPIVLEREKVSEGECAKSVWKEGEF